VGKALESAQTKYSQIATTRYRQIDRLTAKMQNYQLDTTEVPVTEQLPATTEETQYNSIVSE